MELQHAAGTAQHGAARMRSSTQPLPNILPGSPPQPPDSFCLRAAAPAGAGGQRDGPRPAGCLPGDEPHRRQAAALPGGLWGCTSLCSAAGGCHVVCGPADASCTPQLPATSTGCSGESCAEASMARAAAPSRRSHPPALPARLSQAAAPSVGIGRIKARDNPALYGTGAHAGRSVHACGMAGALRRAGTGTARYEQLQIRAAGQPSIMCSRTRPV